MNVVTFACGTKQITLNHDDKYAISILNEAEVEVAQVCSSVRNHLRFSIINYDENNNRKLGYNYSVNLGKKNEEMVGS